MTKDVLISVSGLQYEVDDKAPIELISKGRYYKKEGRHYIRYDESLDEDNVSTPSSIVSNTIKITGKKVELIKRGAADVQMIFEPGKKYITYYNTPFGSLLIGIHTSHVRIIEEEDYLGIGIDYSLDINYTHTSDCTIKIRIRSKFPDKRKHPAFG